MNVGSEIGLIISDKHDNENKICVVNFDNRDVENGIHNIDRIQDPIYESIEIRISDIKLDEITFLKDYVFQ